MKNNYINILLIACMLGGLLPACKKGYLDKSPTDAISSQNFWTNDADVQTALAGVYKRLQAGFFSNRKLFLDAYSDNALDRHNYYGFGNNAIGIVNSTNVTTAFYNDPYNGISSCNFFLDNVDKAPITDANKTKYKAEVKFLRALFYFDLAQAYGGVIIYKKAPISVDAAKIKQSTKDEVLAFIHEDLDAAIAGLPDVVYAGNAVKGSAQALKARVLMLQQKWADAATLTNQIMTGGKFSIYTGGYANLFLTATQQNNPEIIFSTKFLANTSPQIGEGNMVEVGWYGCIAVYQNLVDEYEMTNGKMITELGSGYVSTDPHSNRDPRLKLTVKVPSDPYVNPDGSFFAFSDPALSGYNQKKYLDFKTLPFGRNLIPLTDQNIVHIRYADILLMYAEAKNELSGPEASIYTAINSIRSRPGINMPPVDQTVYNTKDKLREFIRHERRVETAGEGHRYFDLKRWGIMQAKLAPLKNPGGVQLAFGEKNNVLPFPLTELDRNKKLEQNKDY